MPSESTNNGRNPSVSRGPEERTTGKTGTKSVAAMTESIDSKEPFYPPRFSDSSNGPEMPRAASDIHPGGLSNFLPVLRHWNSPSSLPNNLHGPVRTHQANPAAHGCTPMQRWLEQDMVDDPYHTVGFVQADSANIANGPTGSPGRGEAVGIETYATWGSFNDARRCET